MQQPTRPFESLEWYREATRGRFEDRPVIARAIEWIRGPEFLTFHLTVFALGLVLLLTVNLWRNPADLWAANVGLIWVVLIVIHAVAASLAWAIRLLTGDDSDIRPSSEITWEPERTWTIARERTAEPVQTDGPQATATGGPGASHQPAARSGSMRVRRGIRNPIATRRRAATHPGQPEQAAPSNPWASWDEVTKPGPGSSNGHTDEPRASWKEASAAAWLARSSNGEMDTNHQSEAATASGASGQPEKSEPDTNASRNGFDRGDPPASANDAGRDPGRNGS